VVVVVGGTVVVVVTGAITLIGVFWQTVTPSTDVHVPVTPYSLHG
jgi:hypothetical protein